VWNVDARDTQTIRNVHCCYKHRHTQGSSAYLTTAAYDRIDKTGLFKAMEEFHVPRKLRCLVELTLKTASCRAELKLLMEKFDPLIP
jgi:hypothetical protein